MSLPPTEAYCALLDQSERELALFYAQLSVLSTDLHPPALFSSDASTEQGYRMGLLQIQAAVLAARHEIHDALTQVTRARTEIARYPEPTMTMHDTDPDDLTIGALLRHHRERLGLTQFGLAMKTLSMSSSYIARTETNMRPIGRRTIALRIAEALGLDPYETDRFLYTAGFAPLVDWQQVAEDQLGTTFRARTRIYIDRRPRITTREGAFRRERARRLPQP